MSRAEDTDPLIRTEQCLTHKLCVMCGVVQLCPVHGRTPVTAEDYAELHTEVAGVIAMTDTDPLVCAERFRGRRRR